MAPTYNERKKLTEKKSLKDELLESAGLDTREVARALGVSERTVIRWRQDRVNLPYRQIGQKAIYDARDVLAFKQHMTFEVAGFPHVSHQPGGTS
jgi:transcriptional regulator with XRE-family HTH domain